MPRSIAVVLAALCAAFGLSVLALVVDRAVGGDPAERVQARLDLQRGDAPDLRSGAAGRQSGARGSAAGVSDPAGSAIALGSRRRLGGSLAPEGAGAEGIGRGSPRSPRPPGVVPPEKRKGGSGIAGTGSSSSAALGLGGEQGGDGGEGGDDGPPSVAEALPEDVAVLEESAAALALRLGLVDPQLLQQRVERLVPEGSVPPGMLEEARKAAEQRILADAAIAQGLASEYEDRQDQATAKGLYETFSLRVEPETRKEHLRNVPGQLPN